MPYLIAAQVKYTGSLKFSSPDLILTRENPESGDRYVSGGQRCYIIGMQDGNFPPQGWHNVDEMGGIWIPPLKAVDGIWMRINGKYITSAVKYSRKAAWSEFDFKYDDLSINRKDVALDSHPGAMIIYTLKNNSDVTKELNIEIITRFHPIQSYPFVQSDEDYSRNKEAFDFRTMLDMDSESKAISVSTDKRNRFLFCKANVDPVKVSFEKQNDLPIRKSNSYFQNTEADAVMQFNMNIKPGNEEQIIIAIAGSIASAKEAASAADIILKTSDKILQEKENHYIAIANRTYLITPDKNINNAFLWNKLNMEMQMVTSPAVGTGAVAGFPDYPWYFGNDGSFSVPGFLAISQTENAKNHLILVASVSNKVNNNSGKIVHEIVTDGSVYWGRNSDPGNTNETCQFAKAVGQVWKWTADSGFLRELYPTIKNGMLNWLLNTQIEEGDIFPTGFGNAEVTGWGPKRLDVQCYAVEGLLSLADMASFLGDNESSKRAIEWAQKIRKGINDIWWMKDKGYYANSLTKDNKPVLKGEISPIPLESKIPDPEKAKILLENIAMSEMNNEYGWGDMSIGAGMAAVGTANYGRVEESLRYIKGIAKLWDLEMPGGLPEHNPPYDTNRAHKQWSTNAVQLWGGYGLHFPLIRHILGIDPDIPNDTITIIPNLPQTWNKIECNNLIVGQDTLNIIVQRDSDKMMVNVVHSGNHKLRIGIILPEALSLEKIVLNKKEFPKTKLVERNSLSGKEVFIETDLRQANLEFQLKD